MSDICINTQSSYNQCFYGIANTYSAVKQYLQDMEPDANMNERRKYIPLKKMDGVVLNIENDSCTEGGKRVAFTQKQRYTTLEKLKKARKTSELV